MLSLKGTIKEHGVLSEMVYIENPIDYLTSGLLTDSYQLLKSQKNYLTGFYSVLLKNINTEEYVLVFRDTSDPFDISSWYGEKLRSITMQLNLSKFGGKISEKAGKINQGKFG